VEFFKTSLIGGLFVLLPLMLFYLLVSELVGLVIALATPLADLFPKGTFDEVEAPLLIAVILIVGASFLFGLTLRSSALRNLGTWVERNVFGRMPVYSAVKSLSRGLLGAKEDGVFKPAVLNSSDGERELVYLIEDHGNGQVTVLVPWAPASFAGVVKIVHIDRIEMLDATLDDASRALAHWGVGIRDLIGKGVTGSR
jgi:uncharacterized membrane protein